jgi:hypothetical protein
MSQNQENTHKNILIFYYLYPAIGVLPGYSLTVVKQTQAP